MVAWHEMASKSYYDLVLLSKVLPSPRDIKFFDNFYPSIFNENVVFCSISLSLHDLLIVRYGNESSVGPSTSP